MTTIILFSGGRESLYNANTVYKKGKEALLLLFNYGQKSFKKEQESLKYYAELFEFSYRVVAIKLNIPENILTGTNKGTSHVVARNFLFITYTVNLYGPDCMIIFGANVTREYNDGSKEFALDCNSLMRKLYPKIIIQSYTKRLTTERVLELLVEGNYDISHLWFCERSTSKMCGQCSKCLNELVYIKSHKNLHKKIKHLWL